MNNMINERDKEFANDHRFLENEKFKVMMAFMEQLAVNYQKVHYDPHNEWDCTLAHASTASLSFFLSLCYNLIFITYDIEERWLASPFPIYVTIYLYHGKNNNFHQK